MKEKKNAINISILTIIFSLIITFVCWQGKDDEITEIFFVLATGIFGSSFATLWIFIYEYNKEKRELLRSIFIEVNEIMESTPSIPYMSRTSFYKPKIKKYLEGKYYIPPANAQEVEKMKQQKKCLYELCRYVDEILEIGYDKIDCVCNKVEELDFWTDSFRRKFKRKEVIVEKISLPIYDVFISAPAMEEGYIFRYFSQFKMHYLYSAEVIYPLVERLDKAIWGTDEKPMYTWLEKNTNMRCYMHEKLWIFRDAFFSSGMSWKEHRMAMKAFMYDTEYYWIR